MVAATPPPLRDIVATRLRELQERLDDRRIRLDVPGEGGATVHVPLMGLWNKLNIGAVFQPIELMHETLVNWFDIEKPRIGVAGLNPHAGDGGNFGREEIDIIEPAVRKAKAQGLPADGPYPADTVFVRAKGGQFDAVLTMYHDQGQIAMKLLGFDRGVIGAVCPFTVVPAIEPVGADGERGVLGVQHRPDLIVDREKE